MTDFPNLSQAKEIGLDIETYDPELKEKGPGVRRTGYIIGISLAVDEESWYFAFAHESGNNSEKEKVFKWANDILSKPNKPKIGTNILYDLDYLLFNGIKVAPPYYDISIADALLDENQFSFSLDNISKRRLKIGKTKNYLEEYCEERNWKGNFRKHLWKIPGEVVAQYGKDDALLPFKIFSQQKKELIDQNLVKVFKLESRLLELMLQMRQSGVPIDIKKAHSVRELLKKKRIEYFKKLGTDQVWNAVEMAKIFDKNNIEYPRTPKTNAPSFTKPWLEIQENELCKTLVNSRKIDKFIGTFLEGQILNLQVNGKIHPEFHTLKHDTGGTVSGRFSCSNPNLQFIPNKKADPELGPLIREIFVPSHEKGYLWGRADYSQVELRILAHYASGPGSDDIREEYNRNPDTDYHEWMVQKTGKTRKETKGITFGVNYGMGLEKLCNDLNLSKAVGKIFLDEYFEKVPFVKTTLGAVKRVAEARGYIRTILNRRRRFPFWEPADFYLSKKISYSSNKDDITKIVSDAFLNHKKYDLKRRPKMGVKRSKTYKALNALIQGSAADLMKKAMVDIYDAGIFNIIDPLITIHDELDVSFKKTDKKIFKEMISLMENSIKFKVPIRVDSEVGENWGKVK